MHFWISTKVVYLQRWHGWRHMKLLPFQSVLCTPYNLAPCHFMQSHIHKVHTCLATCTFRRVTDLLHATVVTQGWNGYPNKSTESWPWRRKFSCHSCRDSNLWPFKLHDSSTFSWQGATAELLATAESTDTSPRQRLARGPLHPHGC